MRHPTLDCPRRWGGSSLVNWEHCFAEIPRADLLFGKSALASLWHLDWKWCPGGLFKQTGAEQCHRNAPEKRGRKRTICLSLLGRGWSVWAGTPEVKGGLEAGRVPPYGRGAWGWVVCRGAGRAPICSAPQLSTGTQDPGPRSHDPFKPSLPIPPGTPQTDQTHCWCLGVTEGVPWWD